MLGWFQGYKKVPLLVQLVGLHDSMYRLLKVARIGIDKLLHLARFPVHGPHVSIKVIFPLENLKRSSWIFAGRMRAVPGSSSGMSRVTVA